MAGRKPAKRKAAKKKAAKRKVAKKKAGRKKAGKKRIVKRMVSSTPRRIVRPPQLKPPGAKIGVGPVPPPAPPDLKIVEIQITPDGKFKQEEKAKRGNLVVFDNQTSDLRVVRFDNGWPFDPSSRDIFVPASDRSGLYLIQATATLKEYTANQQPYDPVTGSSGGPPGDPILDVDG